MHLRLLILAALIATLQPLPSVACGPASDCMIGDRHYRIRLPDGHDGKTPIGAIVFAHGYTGNARTAVESTGFAQMAGKMKMAIISTKSAGKGWTLPGSPKHSKAIGVDELAYFDRVIEDAVKRFPIDRKRLIASGFSAGGMMVWNLACHRSTQFAGFIPIAGTFWAPIPETCTTPPANIIHIHGVADKTVPLKGRPIRETRQGDVRDAIKMYAEYGNFGAPTVIRPRGLRCQQRRNSKGQILSVCLYSGGHIFHIRHIRQAWEMLVETAGF